MKAKSAYCLWLAIGCLLFFPFGRLAAQPASIAPSVEKTLFESEEVLTLKLRGDIRDLLNSRSGKPKSFSISLSYFKEDSTEVVLPIKARTRGNFRRKRENCLYPPLLLEFSNKGGGASGIFSEQHKLKLVMPCGDEEYLIREWLVYKIYNLVTPKSFRARLVKVRLEDDRKKKQVSPFYGILLEEEKQMASRNKGIIVERKLSPQQTQPDPFLTMAVFEYLIGNTDWSVQYMHNIKLLASDSNAIPFTVPYDFDHAGIVDAPYAHPAEELEMSSVQERRYRGYCVADLQEFEKVIEQFNRLKKDIYQLYTGCDLLDERSVKSTLAYLDEFYKTINNSKTWQTEFTYPCNGKTGNVVIKGLKGE